MSRAALRLGISARSANRLCAGYCDKGVDGGEAILLVATVERYSLAPRDEAATSLGYSAMYTIGGVYL